MTIKIDKEPKDYIRKTVEPNWLRRKCTTKKCRNLAFEYFNKCQDCIVEADKMAAPEDVGRISVNFRTKETIDITDALDLQKAERGILELNEVNPITFNLKKPYESETYRRWAFWSAIYMWTRCTENLVAAYAVKKIQDMEKDVPRRTMATYKGDDDGKGRKKPCPAED